MILDSNNDYVIGVKKNQPKLYNQIAATIADKGRQSSAFTTLECNKGRSELRHIMVSDDTAGIDSDWKGVEQIVGVHRVVRTKGKVSEETAYFISSRKGNAFLYEEGIRSHWSIENSLHWVKDVTFKEDASKIRTGNAPQNISTLRNMGINLFRTNEYENMAQAIRLVANDIRKIYSYIT